MNRSLLVVLLCLLAAMPPGVCACDHSGHPHPASADSPDDDGRSAPVEPHDHDGEPSDRDCPCSCHAAPREAYTSPRSADEPGPGLDLPLIGGGAEPSAAVTSAPTAAVHRASPPVGLHTSLPIYLSIARLRN